MGSTANMSHLQNLAGAGTQNVNMNSMDI